ncbi:MAG: gliding motility-associated C-terminal domain-containing protein [Chitinophagales bacterium]|nr:gliding motility-associated C-terminal domain-containing protein [Chitinophagales bacterium]
MNKYLFIPVLLLLTVLRLPAQVECTLPGQTPITAMMVCGEQPFTINTPAYCGTTAVPVPCQNGGTYLNTNPNFFRMLCFSAGTLGFVITPDVLSANYDWQLFDITNRNPYDIFTTPSMFVACNWSTAPGETGASPDGIDTIVCAVAGEPPFSRMPQLQQGHTYLLMVLNQSSSGGNYQLLMTGGTASISDGFDPRIESASASCDGTGIMISLNKKVLCNSVAADGSDFRLNNSAIISSASPVNCTSLFGTDTIYLTLAQPLTMGLYSLQTVIGTDGNSLLDVCTRSIPAGQSIPVTVNNTSAASLQGGRYNACSPRSIDLQFSKNIRCASLRPDGGGFTINGMSPVQISRAEGLNCSPQGLTNRVRLYFQTPVTGPGNYTISLTAGHQLMDECGLPVINGIIPYELTVAYKPSADFSFTQQPGCKEFPVQFNHAGGNYLNSWQWDFGSAGISHEQNPVRVFTTPGNQTVQLVVMTDGCTDTVRKTLQFPVPIKAEFETEPMICPGDSLRLINKSTGDISGWQWDFGNGLTSNLPTPRYIQFSPVNRETVYPVRLVVNNTINCSDTALKLVRLLSSCLLSVPTAFTPNGDGLNDFLFPLNAERTTSLYFAVFNRSGLQVYQTRDPDGKWDGRLNGRLQDAGIYVWLLNYRLPGSLENNVIKGTSLLIR